MRLPTLRSVPKASPAADPAPAATPSRPVPPWRRPLRVPTLRDLRGMLRQNPGLKLVSLLLAFFLWFSINVSERNAERIVDLQVIIRKIPGDLIVTNPPSDPVKVTLRGPRTIVEGVDEHKSRFAVDLAGASPGAARVELTDDMIRPDIPRRLKVVQIEPARLRLTLERLVQRRLPVRVELAGVPALGYTVTESRVAPTQVEVSGPASKVDELKEIATEPIDVRGQSDTVQRDVPLSWAGGFVTLAPDHVRVTISFEEVIVSREFKGVEVRVLHGDRLKTPMTTPRVDVTIRGPQRLLHNYRFPEGAVTVEAGGLPAGAQRAPIRVDVPAPLEVVARQPETVTLQVSGRGSR